MPAASSAAFADDGVPFVSTASGTPCERSADSAGATSPYAGIVRHRAASASRSPAPSATPRNAHVRSSASAVSSSKSRYACAAEVRNAYSSCVRRHSATNASGASMPRRRGVTHHRADLEQGAVQVEHDRRDGHGQVRPAIVRSRNRSTRVSGKSDSTSGFVRIVRMPSILAPSTSVNS